MRSLVPTRRSTVAAALTCLVVLLVAACGQEVVPVMPSVTPIPAPRASTDLGLYAVTIAAATACSMPNEAVGRSWEGRLLGSGQDLFLLFDPYDSRFVTGTNPSGFGRPAGFTGTRDGDAVRFTLTADESVDYSFVYLVAEGTELAYSGTASGTMSTGGIVATLAGTIVLRGARDHTVYAGCDAADHRMELVRQ